jgi:hypothetical protein
MAWPDTLNYSSKHFIQVRGKFDMLTFNLKVIFKEKFSYRSEITKKALLVFR